MEGRGQRLNKFFTGYQGESAHKSRFNCSFATKLTAIQLLRQSKPVLIWLIAGALLVAGMVVIGGITRLTNSGLSMVEWKLIMGAIPPRTEAEWQETFAKYQQFPEYQKLNTHYTLEDFKAIFWWEYLHRLLGRLIGVVFLIPFIFFWIKGYFNKKWLLKLLVLFALGGFQGFLGWFMVKSGLVDQPDVSHYRLAAHLLAAFGLFCYIIWLIMDLYSPAQVNIRVVRYAFMLRVILVLALLQVMYGAFVAGLNAGLFYPTFPTMNGAWIPPAIADAWQQNGWVSLISDITTVQFIHRWLGITLFSLVVGVYYIFGPSLLRVAQQRLLWLVGVVSVQALLGIFTLIYQVPIALAVAHQFVALVFIGSIIVNLHGVRHGQPVPA